MEASESPTGRELSGFCLSKVVGMALVKVVKAIAKARMMWVDLMSFIARSAST